MQPQSLQTTDGEVLTLRSALCLALFYPRTYTTGRDHGHERQWLFDHVEVNAGMSSEMGLFMQESDCAQLSAGRRSETPRRKISPMPQL